MCHMGKHKGTIRPHLGEVHAKNDHIAVGVAGVWWDILLMAEAEFLPRLIGSSSHYLQGFIHPRWCRISSINSMSGFFLHPALAAGSRDAKFQLLISFAFFSRFPPFFSVIFWFSHLVPPIFFIGFWWFPLKVSRSHRGFSTNLATSGLVHVGLGQQVGIWLPVWWPRMNQEGNPPGAPWEMLHIYCT